MPYKRYSNATKHELFERISRVCERTGTPIPADLYNAYNRYAQSRDESKVSKRELVNFLRKMEKPVPGLKITYDEIKSGKAIFKSAQGGRHAVETMDYIGRASPSRSTWRRSCPGLKARRRSWRGSWRRPSLKTRTSTDLWQGRRS